MKQGDDREKKWYKELNILLSSFSRYYCLFKADNSFLAKKLSIFERNSLYNKIDPSISSFRLVKLSIFKPKGKS
ncbi:hypothetical protein CPS_0275 [Colwellia psychrerythraea 34H]|uniref:Uncharacterized protein n=1 Tax=Colwellia psychrerythraea (strain 34H / ATCC BAA-681) TaxID=167879 RepID=Q48A71_COLP3|nr:hypothetical protein CPS_0275 [Colwellia psychrerythraea 34H]